MAHDGGCHRGAARIEKSDRSAETDKDEVELNRHSAHRAASAMSLGPRRVVVREDKICAHSWPNVDSTIGSTMRTEATPERKVPANEAVQGRSLSAVVPPDSACHAGGRGFECRRSRLLKRLQIGIFVA
jgi:hypothetical protein